MVASKGVAHGVRHVAQAIDYHLERGLAAPTKATLTLTHRCNCRCVMCDLWKFDDPTELSAERWLNLLEELHAWIGTFRAGIAGGEVFLKRGCYDIIRRA